MSLPYLEQHNEIALLYHMVKNISIIGCGNLGISILNGLLQSGYTSGALTASRRQLESLDYFSSKGVRLTTSNVEAIKDADIILLTVKPYNILPVIEEIRLAMRQDQILVSCATGIGMEEMREALQVPSKIFRAMPNTAAFVGESLTCISTRDGSTEEIESVRNIFDSIGETIVIGEDLIDAATVLGACGIAYVLRFIRGMIQGGIEIGFDARTANAIVRQTVKGASQLLIDGGSHPESEIDKVTTPRGCTITGLNEMEHHGFSSSLIKGIVASYNKIGQ